MVARAMRADPRSVQCGHEQTDQQVLHWRTHCDTPRGYQREVTKVLHFPRTERWDILYLGYLFFIVQLSATYLFNIQDCLIREVLVLDVFLYFSLQFILAFKICVWSVTNIVLSSSLVVCSLNGALLSSLRGPVPELGASPGCSLLGI